MKFLPTHLFYSVEELPFYLLLKTKLIVQPNKNWIKTIIIVREFSFARNPLALSVVHVSYFSYFWDPVAVDSTRHWLINSIGCEDTYQFHNNKWIMIMIIKFIIKMFLLYCTLYYPVLWKLIKIIILLHIKFS